MEATFTGVEPLDGDYPVSPTPAQSLDTKWPTEQERELAKQAISSYNRKLYSVTMAHLEALISTRAADPTVINNHAVVKFYADGGGFNQVSSLAYTLNTTFSSVTSDSESDEITELPVAMCYNLALCAFLLKKFRSAERLLKLVHHSLSNIVASLPSSPCHEPLSLKFNHVLPLLIDVSLVLNKPNAALGYLSEADVLAKTLSQESLFASRSLLFRAQAFVLAKQHKLFKRDLKPIGLSAQQITMYEFYRANLEYLKGNHRKASKLLTLAVQQETNLPGLIVSSLHENNLGCLHLMMSKPNLALFHFSQSLQKHNEFIAAEKKSSNLKKEVAISIKQSEIFFNYGIALLHSGLHEFAFQCFSTCLTTMPENPSLWLHLAECCITANKKTNSHEIKHLYDSREPSKNDNNNNNDESLPKRSVYSVGCGPHKKIVIKAANLGGRRPSQVTSGPTMSLEYASQCLKNALMLCEDSDPNDTECDQGNGNGNSINTSPSKSPLQARRKFFLKGSVLLNSAYVELCLANPVESLNFTKKLFKMNESGVLPSGYRMLAQVYAAEALLQLNKINEAIEHLDLNSLQDISFLEVAESGDEANTSGKKGVSDSTAAAKTVFQFNLIVALVMRGELDSADTCLERLWVEHKERDKFGIELQILRLKMHILLFKGEVEKCRELAKKFCGIIHLK